MEVGVGGGGKANISGLLFSWRKHHFCFLCSRRHGQQIANGDIFLLNHFDSEGGGQEKIAALVLPTAHQPHVSVFISCCEGSVLRKCCCLLLPHNSLLPVGSHHC